jgi:hypothetical protein
VKIKARDVIAGWPKGRSTSGFSTTRLDLTFIVAVRSGRGRFLTANPEADCAFLKELEAGVLYHEAQQRMVNEFLERWRTPDKTHAVVIAS